MNETETKLHNILVCVKTGEYEVDFAYGLIIELFSDKNINSKTSNNKD